MMLAMPNSRRWAFQLLGTIQMPRPNLERSHLALVLLEIAVFLRMGGVTLNWSLTTPFGSNLCLRILCIVSILETDMQLAMYRLDGTCNDFGSSFVKVSANDDGGNGGAPFIRNAGVVPGKTYYIQLDGYDGEIGSGYLLISECPQAPDNDDACGAALMELGVPVAWDNAAATAEIGEIHPGPGTVGDGCLSQHGWCNDADITGEPSIHNSVWFKFEDVAPICINIEIDSTDDMQLALYKVSGQCSTSAFGSFVEVAANDDIRKGDSAPSIRNVGIDPGTTYYIQLDGFDGAIGSGDILISECSLDQLCNCGLDSNGAIGTIMVST
jgi:hypothetical protein